MPEDTPASSPKPKAVDIEALAQKVYKLMLEDVRMQKARGQNTRGSGTKQR